MTVFAASVSLNVIENFKRRVSTENLHCAFDIGDIQLRWYVTDSSEMSGFE